MGRARGVIWDGWRGQARQGVAGVKDVGDRARPVGHIDVRRIEGVREREWAGGI